MQSKRINRNFTYSPELKLQAVKWYLNGQSCSSICEHLKIQNVFMFGQKPIKLKVNSLLLMGEVSKQQDVNY